MSEMRKLFSRLFGRRSAADIPAGEVRSAHRAAGSLRQAVAEASAGSDRTRCARALGELLGREGIAPAAPDAGEVWITAVCCAADSAQALTWLEQIPDTAAMVRIATEARATETRLAAAQRIGDIQQLQRIAAVMKHKDRGVYRYCQDRLRSDAAKRKRTERIDALCRRLSDILATCPLPTVALCDVRKQITALEDGEDLAACRALLEQAGCREQRESGDLRALQANLAEADKVLKVVTPDPWPVADRLQIWKDTARQLSVAHASVPEWLRGHKDSADLARLLRAIEEKLARLDEDMTRAEVCRHFLDEHAHATSPDVVRSWEDLPKPESPLARNELLTEWNSRFVQRPKPVERMSRESTRATADMSAINERLAQLEQAIEHGDTQRAFALAKDLDQRMGNTALPRALGERYRRLQGQLGQWRDWARWSGDNAREQLIQAADALLKEDVDVAQCAETVPRLRAEWKRLDVHSRATGDQWRRFDRALAQAYQPVLAYRAERAAREEAARQAKAAFLAEAEGWLQSVVWDEGTVGDIQRRATSLRHRWRHLAPAGTRDERPLSARYQVLMASLDAGLQSYIDLETERRQRLINAANRLQTVTDSREAVAQARVLQQRWRDEATAVYLPGGQRDRQWQQFRKAIDDVFARRDAERHEREARIQERDAARLSLLTEFEQSLRGSPDQHQIEAALARFSDQWATREDQKAPGVRTRGPLEHKATTLIDQAGRMIRELRNARQRELLGQIARKAALAEELETAVVAGRSLDELTLRIQSEWQQGPMLPADIERKLIARLDAGPTATSAELEAGRLRRADLLIDLEILLDLATPASFAAARQQRQLEFLQRGFQDIKTTASLVEMVGTWYGTTAVPDPSQSERMAKIMVTLEERMTKEPTA